ncbi:MAG: response regulator [Treponema sp.]|jgi:DNA-binding response OmpR family regulator|nr:response regulator [Treponema sp.]
MNTRKKILVVDDEVINLEFFDVMLSKLGFEVERAEDGEEGLAKAKKWHPDLVIMDNVMPKMSGWELTRILKEDERLKTVPIIMLSALDDVKDKVEGFELGVEDYITKPYNFTEVLARIRAVLRHRELFSQIAVRESRLALAEEFNTDIKAHVAQLTQSMDGLDKAIDKVMSLKLSGEPAELLGKIKKKSRDVQNNIGDCKVRIEKTLAEWDDLKKNEIGLTILEKQIRRSLQEGE